MVYRSPVEANSFLLQAMYGCSHKKCPFCTMYLDVPFIAVPKAQILAQLASAAASSAVDELDRKNDTYSLQLA